MKVLSTWIWHDKESIKDYNRAAIFIRDFNLSNLPNRAVIAITADSWYRLRINGKWVNDGPARNYPNHFQYDLIDLTGFLVTGKNRVEAVVRYFGIGTAHQLPQQAGFLAQLELAWPDGSSLMIPSDKSWMAAPFSPLIAETARFSIKQEGGEEYDARQEGNNFRPAVELFPADAAPWSGLHERDCQLLAGAEIPFRRFVAANIVTSKIWCLSIPAQRLLHPGLTENNFSTSLACGVVYRVTAQQATTYEVLLENMALYLNGVPVNTGPALHETVPLSFNEGENLLVALVKYPFENQMDIGLAIVNPIGLTIHNPLRPESHDICFFSFPLHHWLGREIPLHMWANRELHRRQKNASDAIRSLGLSLRTASDLSSLPEGVCLQELEENAFSRDEAHWAFRARIVEPAAPELVTQPANLIYRHPVWTTVNPSPQGDVELIYDLGEQQIGYWSFELEAEEGTIVDLFAVEYMTPSGEVQFTEDVRNGFRYTCSQGINRYMSYRRRSGRFLFMTLRHMRSTVKIRNLHVISATYPVDQQGTFHCSNESYNRAWEISVRTVKLCMEDVYTDCPCYEQSLWTGDARNIALFSFPVFAPWDLARRCIRIGGYSLERYPIVGSQVPSSWDCLIPTWSFLWGLSVWDYYMETADTAFLREVFPMVCRNVEGGLNALDPETGLFTMFTWNLFEWMETDIYHPRMVYDSMMLYAALDVACSMAKVLGETETLKRFRPAAEALKKAIHATWLPDLKGYPDSVRKPDEWIDEELPPNLVPGAVPVRKPGPCRDISVHTSMLAILFDIADASISADVAVNVLTPRPAIFQVKNLFARLYLYQAYEKLGESSHVLECMERDYAAMLEFGSTTTWENGERKGIFPARSHSHAWSACATHFFQRLALGLKLAEPGATLFDLSPEIDRLNFAEGHRATVNGPVHVRWEKEGNKLIITTRTPAGVALRFRRNASMAGYDVLHNGVPMGGMHSISSTIRSELHPPS